MTNNNQLAKDLPNIETKSDTKLLSLIIGGLAVLIMLAVIGIIVGVRLLINSRQNRPVTTPVSQQPTPTPTITQISKYASDSAVMKLKNDLSNLGSQIDSTDYFETQILPPSLDSQIKIE